MPSRQMTPPPMRELAIFVIAAQISLVVLELAGRVAHASSNAVLAALIANPVWIYANLSCAVFAIAAIAYRRWEWVAMTFSAIVLGGWAFVETITRLDDPARPPLLSPILVGLFAALAAWLSHYWTE